MYGILLLTVFAADGPDLGATDTRPAPRRYHEINKDMRTWLRREAVAKSKPERAEAVFELTELYQELRRDPRLEDSDTLTAYKNKLWGRLIRVKRDIERELSQARRKRPAQPKPTDQQQAVADVTTAGVADALLLLGYSTGGPAQLLNDVRGSHGGRAIPDYGPDLVSLIESTIAPSFWDVHGGPGSIVYYKPLHAIVVRATGEVHREIGGVLGGLRAAGR